MMMWLRPHVSLPTWMTLLHSMKYMVNILPIPYPQEAALQSRHYPKMYYARLRLSPASKNKTSTMYSFLVFRKSYP